TQLGHEARYSITSSAMESISRETSRPIALAVLRLITNSNLVVVCLGSSAFAWVGVRGPYRTAPTPMRGALMAALRTTKWVLLDYRGVQRLLGRPAIRPLKFGGTPKHGRIAAPYLCGL